MKKSSFTLIELLVVVAIIGILVSILMPSLGEARKTAKRTVCLSNMKQIGIAMQSYMGSNNGFFPRSYKWSQGETPISWDDRLSPFDGRNLSNDKIVKNNPKVEAPLYYCPETPYGMTKSNDRIHRSYGISEGESRADPGNGNHVKRLGVVSANSGWALQGQKIPRPAEGIIVFEYNVEGNHLGSKNNAVKRTDDVRGSGKTADNFWYHKFGYMNFLFADASVRYLSLMATYKGQRSPWDSPDQSGTMWDCRFD